MTYKEHLTTSGFKKSTIKTYMFIVDKFLMSRLPPQDYVLKFNGTYRNNIIKVLAHYFNFTGENKMAGIKQIRAESRIPQYANQNQIKEILNFEGDSFTILRVKAMLEVGISVGIRTSELSKIRLEDLDLENKKVKLHRKGGVESIKDLTDQAVDAINKYLQKRKPIAKCDYLFVNQDGQMLASPYYILKPYLRGLTLHQFFRHSLAIGLLRNKMDLDQLQKVMDHKNISTTSNYLRAVDPNLTEELKKKHPRG